MKFNKSTWQLIGESIELIDATERQLSLRGLFYKHVGAGSLTNSQQSYKRLVGAMSKARLSGIIPMNALSDLGRFVRLEDSWRDADAMRADMIQRFRTDLWFRQPCRVEVWTEKDSVLSMVDAVCTEFHVPLLSTRGDASIPMLHDAVNRDFESESQTVIFYLGDHDPRGLQMVRTNQERLLSLGGDMELRALALTAEQAALCKLPGQAVKRSDSVAADYLGLYGDVCWELDALEPDFVETIVRENIEALIDGAEWKAALDNQEAERAKL